ncbi:hypothetical protein CDL15_Pgr019650 [Punica granatum]|uniref:At1g61320/AtMIF1 LRR domain-containing protein n=1 Tax=Punica granatum TaxID=22663 RepID=A0A218X6S2_PUNGR|nr:hypothetical protein CDL15_Pgr019650 [Punica granatum]
MKEAVRTSILAHGWRFLWSCIPGLDLDFDSAEKVAACTRHSRKEMFCKGGKAASDYVKWVDQVVGTCSRSSTALHHFRIRFRLDKSFSHEIESWLIFSLGKGVEVHELDFCLEDDIDEDPRYVLPSIQPRLFPKLRLLKSLCLGGLSTSNDSLEHLLLACQFLERLHLRNLASLSEVNITGPVSRLKYIDIFRCKTVRSIMISARTPDLLSFTYPGWVEAVHVEHAPRLVDLIISQTKRRLDHFDLLAHPLFCFVAQLQSLHLSMRSWHMVYNWLPHLPNLSGLKHLKLSLDGLSFLDNQTRRAQNLRGMVSLIKAAPCVQHLTLLVVSPLDPELKICEEFANLNLQFLRVIEIVGFRGREVESELAVQSSKCAASLEKLIIDHRHPSSRGCIIGEYGGTKREREEWRRSALEIQQTLPSEVLMVVI